jgi:hypothetical protein
MNVRAIAVAAGLLAAHTAANAWFFFIIPTGAIQSAIQGDHCIPAHAKVGDRITAQGRDWIVKDTSGTSSRCSHTPQWPVIAKLEPILSPAELEAEHSICVAEGTSAGSRTTVPGLGEVHIRSIGTDGCSDQRTPISAKVVRLPNQATLDAARKTVVAPAPAPSPAPIVAATEKKGVVDRLRELKQLRDENLITQELYESKQKEILASP